MKQETVISYRNFRWLWLTLVGLCACCVVYGLNDPPGGRNGGTVVGYTFGTIATLGIIWLMAYGARKRAYHSSLGTVEGWLAAHIWIGIGLLLLVPLHAGFSFGFNVHSAAYVFMVLTIVSGIWGIANYATLAGRISAHRGGMKDTALVEQVESFTTQIEALCAAKSEAFLQILNSFDFSFRPGLRSLLRMADIPVVDQARATQLIRHVPTAEHDDALALIGLLDQRSDLARRLIEQARVKALLKVWLYIHVPVSIALCVALAIHILSVFFLR